MSAVSKKEDKGSNFVEDFVKHSMYNKVDTMEYYDEIQETREYQSLPEIRKIIDNNFQDFCVNNGLWNRVNLKEFISSDENKMLWGLWNVEAQPLKNRYRQHILNYYYQNLDKQVKDVQLENIKGLNPSDYYSKQPPIYKDIPKIEVKLPEDFKIKPSDLELIPYTSEFIRIGKSIQFNVEGFPQNQTLYLLMGMCIVDILKKGINNFKTFKEVINHIKSYVQLNLKSICLDTLELPDKEDQSQSFYNLVTYLTFEDKLNEKQYNYRYSCAEKYFKEKDLSKLEKHTKYVIEPSGKSFILTEYKTKKDVEEVWSKLEDEFKCFGLSDRLIEMWFDGQLLTRSTCLIGVILIILKEQKIIDFLKDEMPDWCSIAGGEISSTFKIAANSEMSLENIKVKGGFTLSQVLMTIKNYISNIQKLSV